MKDKQLKYTHPASIGYNTKKIYDLEGLLKDLSLEKIRVLFTPTNFKWEDLEKKSSKKKSIKLNNTEQDTNTTSDRVD